jgi:hypothetical protein
MNRSSRNKLSPILTVIFVLLCALCGPHISQAQAQSIPEHLSWTTLYEFIDELASEQVITINTAVRPYSRALIAEKLLEAREKGAVLSERQRAEVEFYLRYYRLEAGHNERMSGDIDLLRRDESSVSLFPAGIFHADSMFRVALLPVLGMQVWSNANETFRHRWNGIAGFGYIGENVGVYGSLRDNNESVRLTRAEYLNQRAGAPAKIAVSGGSDYSESRGGITAGWDWGSVGLVKDHIAWGSGYNGPNILSGRVPSTAQITLRLAPAWWFEFNYIHAWLVSGVLDSNATFYTPEGQRRDVLRDKYMAANFFTVRPWRHTSISVGNSIIYSDIGIQAAYLVPFVFYKSVDHTLNGAANRTGQNAQMFLDISTRQLKHLHVYGTLFFDELNTRRFTEGDDNNIFSMKAGARLSNWPLRDVILTAEYTRSNPITYKHNLATTTYESNGFVLGHYLRDNADEIHASLIARPLRGLRLLASFTSARRGPDLPYITGTAAVQEQYMTEVRFEQRSITLEAGYEVAHNARVFLGLDMTDVSGADAAKYVPAVYLGKQNTITGGVHVGW